MIQRGELVCQLKALGVTSDRPLMLHASMRKLGPMEGGAEGLLDAVLECLAPGGTLVMPFDSDNRVPFDCLTSPVAPDVGIAAEVFRKRAGTRVNDHPAGRFGAFGPHASFLLEPTPLHDYLGPGSLLDRFTRAGGSVLRLGADPDTVTLTHFAEYLATVPDKRRVRRHYVYADGREQWIDSLDDSDGIKVWGKGDYFPQILLDFVSEGRARVGKVGNCTVELFAAPEFVAFAVDWMERHLL
jgi:aminoglycoside N3'-acetyltransferase